MQQVPIRSSKAGQVFSSGIPIVVEAAEADETHFKGVDRDTGRITGAMACVPLAVANSRLGVMQILNKRTGNYDARDLALLEHFADLAAVAIRNARLFEKLLAHMGFFASRDEGQGPLELLAELNQPPRLEKISILFADMRGSTQLCQVLQSPVQIQELMSEFVGVMADQVLDHHGIVNKFLGDGLLALFRRDDHARRAVLCLPDDRPFRRTAQYLGPG